MGYHPRVLDLVTGVFDKRTRESRYTDIWDGKAVLKILRDISESF